VTLHEHLRECASCQATLRRARRLDAALANAAGVAVAAHQRRPGATLPELQQRWFAALSANAAPPAKVRADEPATARAAAPIWWFVAGATTIAAALVVAWSFAGGGTAAASYLPARMVPVVREVPAASGAPSASPSVSHEAPLPPLAPLLAAPDAARQLQLRRAAAAPPDDTISAATFANAPVHAAACLGDPCLGNPCLGSPCLGNPCPGNPWLGSPSPGNPATAAKPRIAATNALLDACRTGGSAGEAALHLLVGTLAACGDAGTAVALHARELDLLRESRPARSLLAAWLQQLDAPGARLAGDDIAAIAVAARLGVPEFDAALRRLARRHDESAEFVAAALRCGVRTHGGARLLLDFWQDADVRRETGLEASIALAWFHAQPESVFHEVIAELRGSRASAHRLHCLQALGAADDDSTIAALLECAQSRHRDEAIAAAFALSCLPRRVLDAIVPLAAADEAWLLRAALARAHHDAARPWLEAQALRSTARQRLYDADLARFAEVAGWFRERVTSSD
jgi:hypothetical protein